MNLRQYLDTLDADGIRKFRKRAGLSVMYLSHLRCGRKKLGLEKLIDVVTASHGQIRVVDVRPDLFRRNKKNKIAAMQKAIS